jgi:hypothetical protein
MTKAEARDLYGLSPLEEPPAPPQLAPGGTPPLAVVGAAQ